MTSLHPLSSSLPHPKEVYIQAAPGNTSRQCRQPRVASPSRSCSPILPASHGGLRQIHFRCLKVICLNLSYSLQAAPVVNGEKQAFPYTTKQTEQPHRGLWRQPKSCQKQGSMGLLPQGHQPHAGPVPQPLLVVKPCAVFIPSNTSPSPTQRDSPPLPPLTSSSASRGLSPFRFLN